MGVRLVTSRNHHLQNPPIVAIQTPSDIRLLALKDVQLVYMNQVFIVQKLYKLGLEWQYQIQDKLEWHS